MQMRLQWARVLTYDELVPSADTFTGLRKNEFVMLLKSIKMWPGFTPNTLATTEMCPCSQNTAIALISFLPI